MISSVDHLTG